MLGGLPPDGRPSQKSRRSCHVHHVGGIPETPGKQ